MSGWTRRPRIHLPRSGQTTSVLDYDSAYYQVGNPRAVHLEDLGNGIIADRWSDRMWVKQPELIIPGATGVHTTNQIQAARGNWATSTAYVLADLAVDTTDTTYWVCCSAHTSAAGPTTFAQDRAANPTYWRQTVWTASAANLTTPATMTWDNAIGAAAALEYAGYDDWRMPELIEYVALCDAELATNPPIDSGMFPNMKTDHFLWLAVYYKLASTYAIVAQLSAYNPRFPIRLRTEANYVWPVRGGHCNA